MYIDLIKIFELNKKINGALGRNRTCDLDSGGPRDIHFTTRAALTGCDSSKKTVVIPALSLFVSIIKHA